MRKTTNTTNAPKPEWLLGGNPDAIEAQEAIGQLEFVESSQLPRKSNTREAPNAAEQYSKMGIKVLTSSKGDDLFLGVMLPKGWKKEFTTHSMWNNLVDDKGSIRAMIFYKAAFYDRDAFVDFKTRYETDFKFLDEKHPERDWDSARIISVKDNRTGETLWASDKCFYGDNDRVYQEAKDWLDKNFPDWKDINAYWN